MHFRKTYQSLIQQLLPSLCVLCNTPVKHQWDLCFSCCKELPRINQACFTCGLPLKGAALANVQCGVCQQKTPAFYKTVAAFLYASPIDFLVTGLKFKQKLNYAELMGYLLAHRIQYIYRNDCLPQVIIPVPLHRQRLRERGFNQALEIAKPISRYLNLPLLRNGCRRSRVTLAQSELPAMRRYQNVKGAFRVKITAAFSHVAIVDDVMTTGSTVNELANVLQKHGIGRVDVWCCARVVN